MNPYRVLGLEEGASQAQIKAAYRKLALKHHVSIRSSFVYR